MGMPAAAPDCQHGLLSRGKGARAYALGPGRCLAVTRFIGDFWSSGVPLPPQEAYGMAYVVTAQGDSTVYFGTNVYIEDHGDKNRKYTWQCTIGKKSARIPWCDIPSSVLLLLRSS